MVNQIAHTINSTRVLIKIEKGFILSVITLGATSIVTQIILLREFLSVFYGNELVIGIVLANWMVATSAGSYLGKYSDKIKCKTNFIAIPLCLVAILPAATVFLLSFLRNIVFTAGSMISIMQILCSSFILLIPYCLLSGFLFTFFSHTISERYQSNLITKIYSWEAIGSLIGGFLFNIVMIYFLKTFQSLMLMMMLNLIAALILSFRHSRRTLGYAIIFVSIICLLSTVLIDFDGLTKKFLFQDQDILYYKPKIVIRKSTMQRYMAE
jgi:spermidine synthase